MSTDIQQRQVKLFISSTFQGLYDERDVLAKQVFPEIHRRCRQRKVDFVEIDLRWGIPKEQVKSGAALPVCLGRIDDGRPYFLGLLGERYGSAMYPEQIPIACDRYPWVEKYQERSITELEVLHALFPVGQMTSEKDRQATIERALFYFREPKYVDTVPEKERKYYLENNPEKIQKQKALKQRIRDQGCCITAYQKPADLKELVLEHLWALIDKAYPEGSQPTDFEQENLEQDAFALESHLKAARAQKEGRFADEIFPITLPRDPSNVISEDNGIRPDQSMEALARLKPVFVKEGGTLTARNSSQITDGAVMMLVMSEAKAREYGFEILTRVKMFSFAGVDPKRMGLGPAFALSKMMRKIGISFKEVGLFEINEAFAAQVIANLRIMESDSLSNKYLGISHKLGEIPADLLNVNGGAIALGHPVGASGARLILTLGLEMKRRNVLMGLASLCIGGGQGAAFLLQNY